jgi:predicted lipid-binding transport protein (Tim44 family)
MNKELMEIVLPRLAQRLNRQLRRYRAGELDDAQFSHKFEMLLQQQYAWLANQGIPEVEAAIAVHGAVLVLSGPGLRAEAAEQAVPLEVVEFNAIRAAATDIAANYGVGERKTLRRLCALVAFYAE